MSILKYKAIADASITNGYYAFTDKNAYLSNNGAADSLELFSIYHSGSDSEKSRILINFPIEKIREDRQNGIIPPSGSINFYLKLYDVAHTETIPRNYYTVVTPISSSWDEGYGLDLDNRLDNGQSGSNGYGVNWLFRSLDGPTYNWITPGGDFIQNYSKTFYFDSGLENLSVDVTNIVEDQISNIIPSNGFCIKLSGSYEDGSFNKNFYTKRFSARSSEFFYKVPTLEAVWETLVKDDRNNFFFKSDNLSNQDNTQNIYFYNKFNGQLKNLNNNPPVYVKILNSSGVQVGTPVTASNFASGSYSASIIVTGSIDEELTDVWYSGSYTFYTGLIDGKVRIFEDSSVENEYIFAITNLKKLYKTYEKPAIRIFGRQKDWSPNIYNVANKAINTLTFNNLYYKITRVVDNYTIIDYGIDPIAYTKCSYDKNGNYFELDMSIFEPGYMYEIYLMTLNGDIKTEYINSYRFKVE